MTFWELKWKCPVVRDTFWQSETHHMHTNKSKSLIVFSGKWYKSFLKQYKNYTCLTSSCLLAIQNKSFMRVKGSVQLSTYRMRSRELNIAEEFLLHVRSLPLQYEKGIYFAFLEDYGTHYTKNGKTGGEYELIYVLNQDTIKAKSMFSKDWILSNCYVLTCVRLL